MKKIPWIITILLLAGTAIIIPYLPDQIATHFDLSGTVDDRGSKYILFLFPAIQLLMTIIMTVFIIYLEKKRTEGVDDKKAANAHANAKVMEILTIVMSLLFVTIEAIVIGISFKGEKVENMGMAATRLSMLSMGLILIVVGNLMPKTRKNWIVGIRLPWSIYNDTTWSKTHRFGGAALMVGGAITILGAAILPNEALILTTMFVALMLSVIVTMVYSYKVYKEEKRKTASE